MSYDPTATQPATSHFEDSSPPDDSRDHPSNWVHPLYEAHANYHPNFDGDGDND